MPATLPHAFSHEGTSAFLCWLLGISVLKFAFEQHEHYPVEAHVRRQSHQQLCEEVLYSQAHVVTQSVILKRKDHMLGFLVLASDVVKE